MGCFAPDANNRLRRKPLQQFWRDHLLAGAHRAADKFADGFFVLLSPANNTACATAATAYRACLTCCQTFQHWTIESFVAALRQHCGNDWTSAIEERYLAFAKVDQLLC
jgi:hypothetical protein